MLYSLKNNTLYTHVSSSETSTAFESEVIQTSFINKHRKRRFLSSCQKDEQIRNILTNSFSVFYSQILLDIRTIQFIEQNFRQNITKARATTEQSESKHTFNGFASNFTKITYNIFDFYEVQQHSSPNLSMRYSSAGLDVHPLRNSLELLRLNDS